jgi:glycine/D-amino acid oxidase-like deaminating enzyme
LEVIPMKLESYWTATAPAFMPAETALPSKADVAVIGGGFTGLSAALAFAKQGADVVVLEAGDIPHEASGRNGGHVNNGLAHDYASLADSIGRDRAAGWYRAYDAAVDTVQRLVGEEAIDCSFARNGKLKLAARPAHCDALAKSVARLHADGVDTDVEMIDASRIRGEVDSDQFHGGLLYKRSAQMHMGRFAAGLATAAQRRGARIHQRTTANRLERVTRDGHAHRVHVARGDERGVIDAKQVLVATGATRHGDYSSFGYWRRRIVPIGSFIIVTEPLGRERAERIFTGRRTYTTTANLHHYFRLTPDDRLVWGGRARFAMSSPTSDEKSGIILKAALAGVFPQLGDVKVDYCWGGLVDMTRDRLPRAGEHDGLWYSMGYSGHGTQMSVHMGQCMAQVMAGDETANPWRNLQWPAIPGHVGPPWFLPAIGLYYKLKDMVS